MNIEIKNFLIGQQSPEIIDLYEQAWNAMVALNHRDFAIAIDEMMMLTASNQIDSFIKHFREHMHANMDLVIEQHGLTVSEDMPTLTKIKLLEFFIQIELTEFIEPCVRLLESDETNYDELFCEIVNIVSGVSVDDLLPCIGPVSNSVISNMRAYMKEREKLEISMESIEDPDIREHYHELEQYCRTMKAQTTVGYVLAFQPDGRVGGVFEDLFSIHFDKLNRQDVGSLAKELVALALNSDAWRNPQVEIEKVLPNITENLKELSSIQAAVTNELQLWKKQ